jgi:hypothetical protein
LDRALAARLEKAVRNEPMFLPIFEENEMRICVKFEASAEAAKVIRYRRKDGSDPPFGNLRFTMTEE